MNLEHHNFNFGTGYEIFDKEMNIISSNFNNNFPNNDCECGITFDNDRICKNHNIQPMKSFTKGFLYAIQHGLRMPNNFNYSSSGYNGICVGYSGQNFNELTNANQFPPNTNTGINYLLGSPWQFSNKNNITSTYSKEEDSIVIELISDHNIIKRASDATYRQSGNFGISTHIGGSMQIWAIEFRKTAYTIGSNAYLHFRFRIKLPSTNTKTLTENWVKNFLQNVNNNTPFIYKTMDGYNVEGIVHQYDNTNIANTFTRFELCKIILGSSNSNVNFSDYKLNQKINDSLFNIGEIHYTSILNDLSNVGLTNYDTTVTPNRYRTCFTEIYQDFTNISSDNISIQEAGIISDVNNATNNDGIEEDGKFLLAHWLTGGVIIEPRQTLRVYFTPSVHA